MSEVNRLLQSIERVRSGALNITVAEHEAKDGRAERLSVVLFDHYVVVVTISAVGKHWQITEVKADTHFDRIEWPTDMQVAKTPEGAFTIIEAVIDCAAKAHPPVAA
jgi:hypothetical protein